MITCLDFRHNLPPDSEDGQSLQSPDLLFVCQYFVGYDCPPTNLHHRETHETPSLWVSQQRQVLARRFSFRCRGCKKLQRAYQESQAGIRCDFPTTSCNCFSIKSQKSTPYHARLTLLNRQGDTDWVELQQRLEPLAVAARDCSLCELDRWVTDAAFEQFLATYGQSGDLILVVGCGLGAPSVSESKSNRYGGRSGCTSTTMLSLVVRRVQSIPSASREMQRSDSHIDESYEAVLPDDPMLEAMLLFFAYSRRISIPLIGRDSIIELGLQLSIAVVTHT